MPEKEQYFAPEEGKKLYEEEKDLFEEAMQEAQRVVERLNEAWKEANPQIAGRLKEEQDFFLAVIHHARESRKHLAEPHEAIERAIFKNAFELLQEVTRQMNDLGDALEEKEAA